MPESRLWRDQGTVPATPFTHNYKNYRREVLCTNTADT